MIKKLVFLNKKDILSSIPITKYYEGIEFCFNGLQPEKNDY